MSGTRLPEFRVEPREAGGGDAAVLALAGDLVVTTAPPLEEAVDRAIAAGARRVVLDLSGLEHVDTAGLACLVRLAGRCRDRSAALRLAGLRRGFEPMVGHLRVDARLDLARTVAEALETPAG